MMQLTSAGFEAVFHHFSEVTETQSKAYEMAEKVHVSIFGRERYSDHDSFKKYQTRKRTKSTNKK
jgi:hypothetical protein